MGTFASPQPVAQFVPEFLHDCSEALSFLPAPVCCAPHPIRTGKWWEYLITYPDQPVVRFWLLVSGVPAAVTAILFLVAFSIVSAIRGSLGPPVSSLTPGDHA